VPTRLFIRSFVTAEGHRGQPRRDGRRAWRDERSYEAALAHGVGAALDVLAHDGAADPVLAKLDAIYETQAAICDTLMAMRESLAALPQRPFHFEKCIRTSVSQKRDRAAL
jgi:hypothetical protein